MQDYVVQNAGRVMPEDTQFRRGQGAVLNTDGAPKERSTPRSQIHSTTDADSDPDWEFSVQNNVIQNAGRVMPEKRTISGEARVRCSGQMARQSSQSHVLICAARARGTAIAGHRAQH